MGLPTVTVTSLPSVALKVGANRVLRGTRFSYPCGNPALSLEKERDWRLNFIRSALRVLQTEVEKPTLFEPDVSGM
jgi:glycine reductase complex component B subunit gamma